MSLMFFYNTKNWNSRIRIFMMHTTRQNFGNYTGNGAYAWNYMHAARRVGTSLGD